MADIASIEQTVERAVSQALEAHVANLRQELVARVIQEVQSPGSGSYANGSGEFLKAISAIHAGGTQREILRALLDNTVRYTGRSALFVIKAGSGTGWQGRGFANIEEIKDFVLDVNATLPSRAISSRMPFSGRASEMDSQFMSKFGTPADGKALVLPLLLKDKVAALIYADAGQDAGGKLDSSALEALVIAASAWLEVVALRKQAHKDGVPAEAAVTAKPEPTAKMQAAPAYSDPFASAPPSHSDPFAAAPPAHAAASAAAVEEAAVSAPEIPPAPAEAAFAAAAGSETAAASETTGNTSDSGGTGAMSPEDSEVHRKAQRFARLLVDEIKLYNQAKVHEGRSNKDLYDRLKEDIDKSQATYQKRYGSTVAASSNYFRQELVHSLAEDDASVMGPEFSA